MKQRTLVVAAALTTVLSSTITAVSPAQAAVPNTITSSTTLPADITSIMSRIFADHVSSMPIVIPQLLGSQDKHSTLAPATALATQKSLGPGSRIYNSANKTVCTTGFLAHNPKGEKFLLTAAHCTRNDDTIQFYSGDTLTNVGPVIDQDITNDVALVKITNPNITLNPRPVVAGFRFGKAVDPSTLTLGTPMVKLGTLKSLSTGQLKKKNGALFDVYGTGSAGESGSPIYMINTATRTLHPAGVLHGGYTQSGKTLDIISGRSITSMLSRHKLTVM